MTGIEAAQKFKVEINKLDRSSLIDVRIEKVLHYLNKAALFLVKRKYKGNDPGPGRLEVNHPVLDDLKVLIKEETLTEDASKSTDRKQVFDFELDHLYYLSSELDVLPDDCNDVRQAEGRYVKPERVPKELLSPFNGTDADDPLITISDNQFVVYRDGFNIEDAHVRYLSAPAEITSSQDELELPFGDEIIDTAVSMALENFESQRIKTQPGVNVVQASE